MLHLHRTACLGRTVIRMNFLTIVLFASTALADDAGEKLMGTWQVEGSNPPETWTLVRKGDVQTIVRTEAGNVTLNLKCKLTLAACRGIDSGRPAKVTMYASGSALVHWELQNTNLIIRRFALDGQALTIEARDVTGQGKSRALRLIRRFQAAAKP